MKQWFINFTSWLKEALTVLWVYRVIVVALLVLYLALWQMDQGQDLLVNLNDSDAGIIIFYVLISIMAALFWHLPKFFSQNSSVAFNSISNVVGQLFNGSMNYTAAAPKDSNIARMLGVLTFLIPAFAVLNVLDKYDIPVTHPLIPFSVLVLVYIYLFHYNWIEKKYLQSSSWKIIFHAIIISSVLATIMLGWLNHQRPYDLVWLCLGLCLLSVAFAIAVSIRRHVSIGFFLNRIASRWVMWPALLMALLFVFANFAPYVGMPFPFFTISVLLFALVFYVLLFTFLLLWGRVAKINFAGFFMLLVAIANILLTNPFHDIRQIPNTSKIIQDSLTVHLHHWLDHRKKEIESYNANHKPYPVFIVNAYGGGIRAAAWTSLVIQQLDSLVRKNKNTSFQHHLIAYSGASGGTIGASVMCAMESSGLKVEQADLLDFYRKDFLSPVLIGLTGRDFFLSTFGRLPLFFGIHADDRAALQEKAWESQFSKKFGNYYSLGFNQVWRNDTAYTVPLLLSNTTEIKKGLKGIVAPVILDSADFPGAVMVDKLLEHGCHLNYSTAAFLSARFPLISPAGKMDKENYFMDGGLKENSGAETARQLKNVLERIICSDVLQSKIEVFILSLPNTSPNAKESKRNNIVQSTAPLLALETNWEGTTRVADSINRSQFKKNIFGIRPNNNKLLDGKDSIKAVLPLGWQLSSKAIARMKQCLKDNRAKMDSILKVF